MTFDNTIGNQFDTDLACETMSVCAKALANGDRSGITSLSFDLARDIAASLMRGGKITANQRDFLVAARKRCTVDA